MTNNIPKIVIVGGGFGGVKLARTLAKENVEITLVDRHNFHLFQPLLYQVSTSVLSTDEIAYPLRAFFRGNKNIELFMAKAEGVDQERKVLLTNHGEIPYDYLVLAAGGTTNYFGNENLQKYTYAMKTIQEALHIRNHVLHMFERASKHEDDDAMQRRMLSFVVVGGGPTGVEEAGAIAELIEVQKKEFHNLDFSHVSVKLLEASPNILPMMPPDLRQYAIDVLKKKGVEVILNAQVTDYDGDTLSLKNGTLIPTRTVIWAAGIKAVSFISNCGSEVDRSGRLIVNEHLQISSSECVFAIGDCACFHHGTERPLPTVAPVATQEATTCAHNIMKLIKGDKELETFRYADVGAMATIGIMEAVVAKGAMKLSGILAWYMWMFVHLIRLEGHHAHFTVFLKWNWNLIAGTRLGRIITNVQLSEE